MLLQRISLKRFRQLGQHEYTFQPGFNLIKGSNEAGKSTLQEAILFALLGNPRRTTLERVKSVDDHISWGQDRRFSITLDFKDNRGTLYRLSKDWDKQSACLKNLQTCEEVNDIDSIQCTIGDILGYGSLKLLQSTVCVEQDSIDSISTGRQEIGDQLQSIVTSGAAGEAMASKVLQNLNGKIAEMERGWRTSAPKNPGLLKVKHDEINRLDEQLTQMRPQVRQVEEAKDQLIVLDSQINEISESLTTRQSLINLCNQYMESNQEYKTWLDKERELEARIERYKVAQNLADRAGQSFDKVSKPRLPTVPIILASFGGFLLLTGLLIGVLGLLATSKPAFVIAGALLGLPGLLISVSGLIWLARTLERSSSVDPIASQSQIDALLGGNTLEELIEQRKKASRNRRDVEEVLESPEMCRTAKVTPLEYEKLKHEIESLQKELDENKQQQIKCEARCEVANFSIEDIHRLEESKVVAERYIIQLEERLSIYKLTRDVIQEAKEQTMRSARDELEPRIGDYLNELTCGRYYKVEADDDLNLRVFCQEKGDWVKAEDDVLSRGTIDQLYLAARLALLDLLYKEAKPPLLLDDPFIKFDPERSKQAMDLCVRIARDHQILLFTCHDTYDSVATNVIRM